MIRNIQTTLGSVRAALAVGATVPFLVAASAFAQAVQSSPAGAPPATQDPAAPLSSSAATAGGASPAAQAGGEATTDRVIVTGSNIPTAEEVGPNPVLTLSRDLINKSGESSVERFLIDQPVAQAQNIAPQNNATGFTPGASTIALRGFDPRATLILVDGRRVAPYPIGIVGIVFVDLNSLPTAAIQSIEILKDGASTIYGADAIAGVVNLKLRHDYRGAEIQTYYGNTADSNGDAGRFTASAIFGVGNETTSLTGVLNFYHENSIFNRDRAFSRVPPFLSTNSSPANLQLARATVLRVTGGAQDPIPNLNPVDNPQFFTENEGGRFVLNAEGLALVGFDPAHPLDATNLANIPGATDKIGATDLASVKNPATNATEGYVVRNTIFGHAPFLSDGSAGPNDYTYSSGRSSFFNFNQFSGSTPDSERYGGYFNASHKVFGDSLIAYADMLYQNVKTHNELAPAATGSFQTAGQVTLAIPPNSPGAVLPPGTPTYEATGIPVGAFNPFNPFNQIISGGSRYRLAEFGNRKFDDETDAFLTTLGIRGDKLFNGTWAYDGAFRYSQVKSESRTDLVSTSRFNRVLNAADPIFDPTSPEFIGTTVPYNPFGDYRNPPPTNAATVEFATVHPKDFNISKLATLDFTMSTTALFNLPAGGIGFAFGGQFRRENIDQDPDLLNLQGDIIGSSPTAITHGGRKSYGIYAETQIPVFSPQWNIPGFYAFEFDASVRYEEFLNNDTNVAVPKFGIRWQPLDSSLTLRSTFGKGFRQPSLYELFAGPTASLQGAVDPQTGVFDPEVPTLTTSNPNLQPEDSEAFTAGIVYTPKYVPGLTLSIDYYNIERTGVVGAPTLDVVLDREESNTLLPGETVERDAGGTITRVTLSNQNASFEQSQGFDFGLQYALQTRFGTFTSYTNATYLDQFLFASTDLDVAENFRGRTTDEFASDDGFLKWKGVSRLNWNWNHFDTTLSVRYIDGFHEHKPFTAFPPVPPGTPDAFLVHYVKQQWIFDLQAGYDFTYAAPVEEQPVAGYSKDAKSAVQPSADAQASSNAGPIWQRALNGTSVTFGIQNLFDEDPPQAYGFGGNATNYPGNLYIPTGRFFYMQLTKKF